MKSTNPLMRLRDRAVWRHVPLLAVAATVLLMVDGSSVALPFESWLAERMASALRCVFVGVGADPALMGTVAPSCAGLRTATAVAILGACLAARRKWLGALVGALCGLGLNFVRLVAIEAVLRVDHAAGMMLHDLALYAIVLPAALLAAWLWRAASRPARLTLAGCALYLGALLTLVDLPQPLPPPKPLSDIEARALAQAVMDGSLQTRAPRADLTDFYLGLSRPGAGIHTGAPAVSRPRFQDDRRFDTPAPRVRDPGTPAPGQTL